MITYNDTQQNYIGSWMDLDVPPTIETIWNTLMAVQERPEEFYFTEDEMIHKAAKLLNVDDIDIQLEIASIYERIAE